jgi:ribosomal protein S18 acetylase RimI-like enzyme
LASTYILDDRSFFGVCYDENNGRIVWTLAARPYDKEYPSLYWKYNSLDTASLWRHYVDPDYRRKWYASSLYRVCEKHLLKKGFQNIYLHVQDNWSGSLEYRKIQGFSETFRENDQWKTIHMEKIL